jgi:hypothetical protein
MMPQINISQPLFAKLQSIAEPFVDTPETAIAKAVEFYLLNHNGGQGGSEKKSMAVSDPNVVVCLPDAPPDLSFTRPVSIELDGKKFPKQMLYWNPLLFELVRLGGGKVETVDQLKQMLLCNYVDGKGDEKIGYRFISEAKLSVQGQAANPAWKSIFHLAKKLGVSLDVTFVWEEKPKAAYPGKTGMMKVAGI